MLGHYVKSLVRMDDVDSFGDSYCHAIPGSLGKIIGYYDEVCYPNIVIIDWNEGTGFGSNDAEIGPEVEVLP